MKRSITVLALAAVTLAATTGAFAAQKYLITSSSQIKPGVISYANLSAAAKQRLAGRPGASGAAGAAGPAARERSYSRCGLGSGFRCFAVRPACRRSHDC